MSGAIFRGSRSAESNPSITQFRSVELPVTRQHTHTRIHVNTTNTLEKVVQFVFCRMPVSSVSLQEREGVV